LKTEEHTRGGDPEAAYYQTIEEFFVSRRGDPLFIANADWVLIREWRLAGLPLRVVLRGIADAFEGHAHSWSRNRKVGSLAYCKAEVEAARERWERALQLGVAESPPAAEFLAELAGRLASAPALGPRAAALARSLAAELRERAAAPLEPRALEPWLMEREGALVGALGDDLGPEGLGRHEADVDADLAPYRARLPAKVLAQVRESSLARRLLEAQGLPRLSLFELSGRA
jgi:hypothetical protein